MDELGDLSWNPKNKKALRNLLQDASGVRVAIFKPSGNMDVFYLNFCEMNLSFLKLEAFQEDSGIAPEFYHIYEIYLENGVYPDVQMDKGILQYRNNEGVSNITNHGLVS